MKYYKYLLLLTISLSISCSKDDQISKKGEIIFENQNYEINNGYINFRSTTDLNIYDIHLSNDNTIFNKEGKVFGTNSKTTLDLIFVSEKNSENEVTFYPLRYSNISGNVLKNAPPYLLTAVVDFNLKQENGNWTGNPRIHTWEDGSATLENINGEYKITFHLSNGNTEISGNYYGPLEVVPIF